MIHSNLSTERSASGSRPARVTLALLQMSCSEAKPPNVDKAVSRIAEAAAAGAQIVCLQELFAGHYFCQSEDHARFAAADSAAESRPN